MNIGSRSLHLTEAGSGRPAVILESGIAASSLSWARVQPQVAAFARTASYDRAGLGWSNPSKDPRTVEAMVSDLRRLLSSARIPPPYILVGHSFGGLLVRAFANLFPAEVAGLVLVDPVSVTGWANCGSEQRRRLALGIRLSRRGAILARLGVVRLALNLLLRTGTRLPKLVAKTTARKATSFLDRIGGEIRRLPPELWPAIRAHWSRPKSFRAMAEHLANLESCARLVTSMSIPVDLPITILSASTASSSEIGERETWTAGNPKARHIRLVDCGHWVQLERPEAVVQAVLDLVASTRELTGPKPTV